MPKVEDKERILKAAREMWLVNYRVVLVRLSAEFSNESLQATRDCQEISKVMNSRDLCQDFSTQQSYYLESKGT